MERRDNRLARATLVAPDLVASGGMAGEAHFFDFSPARQLVTQWSAPLK